MQEDVIPWAKDHIDGVDIGKDQSNNDFRSHSEVHVEVVHALGEDWLSSCLTDDVVEELTDEVGIEVAWLGVFYCLCSKANWTVGIRRNLLHSARTILEILRKDELTRFITAFQCAHTEITSSLLHIEPIYQLWTIIEAFARSNLLAVNRFFEKTISIIRVCGIEGVWLFT